MPVCKVTYFIRSSSNKSHHKPYWNFNHDCTWTELAEFNLGHFIKIIFQLKKHYYYFIFRTINDKEMLWKMFEKNIMHVNVLHNILNRYPVLLDIILKYRT